MVTTRNERQRIQARERRSREKSTRLVSAAKWVGRRRELWFTGRRERLILMHPLVELEEVVGWHPSKAEAECKESHFYSLTFGQVESNIY